MSEFVVRKPRALEADPPERVQEEAEPEQTGPPNPPGGMPYHEQSPEELRALQECQAAHAFAVQAQDLASRNPIAKALMDENARLKDEIERLKKRSK